MWRVGFKLPRVGDNDVADDVCRSTVWSGNFFKKEKEEEEQF